MSYDANSIETLSFRDATRSRAAMYMGSEDNGLSVSAMALILDTLFTKINEIRNAMEEECKF